VVVEKKSKTGLIVGCVALVLIVVVVIPLIAILAVTFLGKSASSKFSRVGSSVNDISLQLEYLSPYLPL